MSVNALRVTGYGLRVTEINTLRDWLKSTGGGEGVGWGGPEHLKMWWLENT